ncbi:MAG: hypothetical protein INQ03_24790 [Candidatus Heimdallarchaeota archaeon]|nr:hypothetical protein [Candidatus Heimdallarchaeota archaeon]
MRVFVFIILLLLLSQPVLIDAETDTIETIISSLDENAIYDGEILLGWPYRINSSLGGNDRLYVGYTTGMAGVGHFLLDAYDQGYESALPLIQDILHYFKTQYVEDNGTIYWPRMSNQLSDGWMGIRYGWAGVMKFISHAFGILNDLDLPLLMERSLTWFDQQKLEDGWPINPGGYITTGWEYGAAGLIDAFLDMLITTGNRTYLDKAVEVGHWIVEQGYSNDSEFIIPWSPNEYGSNEYDNLIVTGSGVGIAGIIQQLLRITVIQEEPILLEAAKGMGQYLLRINQGGYWDDTSVGYITNLYDGHLGLTGYHIGAAGFIPTFLSLFDITGDEHYLEVIAQIERFLEAMTSFNQVDLGMTYDKSQFTGYSKGSAGVAQAYLDLYRYFGINHHLQKAEGIVTQLSQLVYQGLVPIDEKEQPNILGFAFNLEEGIAGIGKVILEASRAGAGFHDTNYLKIYNDTPLFNQQSSVSPTVNFPSYYLLLILIPLLRRRVGRRRH